MSSSSLKNGKKPSWRASLSPPVFFTSAGLLVSFLLFGVFAPELAEETFPRLLEVVTKKFGWFYVSSVTGFILLALWLLWSPYANLCLGRDDEEPEFSNFSWFSMLFSAGMGIGLVFYGVAEPVFHFVHPPYGAGSSAASAELALPMTFFHWGIHAWAIYVIVGLGIAYFAFRRNLPLALRSCFTPLLGEQVNGWWGHCIDIIAVFGTLFGLATSLGLGAMQVNAGLDRLFGVPQSTNSQILLILFITLAATISLVTGVKKGIRRLSEVNLVLAFCLLLFVFLSGPTQSIVTSFVESVGRYGRLIVERSLIVEGSSESEASWMRSWTLFYWGWWISWAPFVGMFIARISRGRTIREFILGVLLVPTTVTMIWFSVFGETALWLEQEGGGGISQAVTKDTSTAIYVVLSRLPLGAVTSFLAALVVAVFFVTSSDSASFVVDMLTSGGRLEPQRWQRIFWASAEGATAAVLLYSGGKEALSALQAAVIAIGLPFCAVAVALAVCLVVALRREKLPQAVSERGRVSPGKHALSAGPKLDAASSPLERSVEGSLMSLEGGRESAVLLAGRRDLLSDERKIAATHQLEDLSEVNRILVPVDLSEASARAVSIALELSRRLHAEVDLLHVAPAFVDYLPMDDWIWGERRGERAVHSGLEEAAQNALDEFLTDLSPQEQQGIRRLVRSGTPSRGILTTAASGKYELLVLSKQGQNESRSRRIGSVAERVVRYADCGVVVVR
ncbi:MAG: BCCT family transporter [Polyangiaceae bacterium]|nr:BCCT family transporter [Polyangiaceae bacterium]